MRRMNKRLNDDSIALAATGTSDTSPASTAFVQQEISGTSNVTKGTHIFGSQEQPQNTTYYIGENGFVGAGSNTASATEADMYWWPVVPVTLRDLYISANTTPAAGQTATVTIMKNGAATSLTAQITSAGGVISDTSNLVDAGPGDYLSFRSVLSATSGTLSLSCSVRFTDQGTGRGISLIPYNYITSAAAETACPGLCLTAFTQNEPHNYPVVHENAFIGTFYQQTTSTGTVPPYVRVGGGLGTEKAFVKQTTPYLMGTDGTELSGITPPNLALTSGSFFAFTNPIDGAAVRRRGSWTLLQKSTGTADVQLKPLYFTCYQQAQATTRYMAGHGCIGHATEATKQFPLTAGVLKNFILMNEDAGVDGQTWTANVRVNGAQVLQIVLTMSGVSADQKVTDTSSSLTVVAGDRLSIELVSSATTGTKDIQFACDHLSA